MTSTSAAVGRSPGAAHSLLVHARQVLAEAEAAGDAGERFRLAHLSALRTAAAVSAQRGRPASARRTPGRCRPGLRARSRGG